MPRKYLVAIIRAWWFPLVMGFVIGTVVSTWSIVETIEAFDVTVLAELCGAQSGQQTESEVQ